MNVAKVIQLSDELSNKIAAGGGGGRAPPALKKMGGKKDDADRPGI